MHELRPIATTRGESPPASGTSPTLQPTDASPKPYFLVFKWHLNHLRVGAMGEGAGVAAELQNLAPCRATLHAHCSPTIGRWEK